MKIKSGFRKFINSFPFRASLKFSIVVEISMIIMFLVIMWTLNKSLRIQQGNDLTNSCNETAEILELWKDSTKEPYFHFPFYVNYSVYDVELGFVIFTNDPFIPQNLKIKEKPSYYFEKNYFSDGDLMIMYYKKAFQIENPVFHKGRKTSEVIITTSIYLDSDYFNKLIKMLPKFLIPLLAVILMVSFATSFIMAKNTIRPIERITREAKKRSISNIDKALPVSRHLDEIDELAQTFNKLFIQIKNDYDREKQFSSDVSHELKTPVAVISGQANLLLRWGKDDPKQLETSLKAIKQEAFTIQNIIDTLLQISRYESGLVKPEYTNFDLRELFEFIKKETEFLGHEKKAQVSIILDEDMELFSEPEMLHQIFTVFISNSLKFSSPDKECKISLEAHRVTIRGKKKLILIESDNGPGFAEEDLPKIFNRFYMGSQSRTRDIKKHSTGLGLSIAKTLCESLGGKINAGISESGGARLSIVFDEKKVLVPKADS